jgi:hypothetical protein
MYLCMRYAMQYVEILIRATIKTMPRRPSQHETCQRLEDWGPSPHRARIHPLNPEHPAMYPYHAGKTIGVRRCNASTDQWMTTMPPAEDNAILRSTLFVRTRQSQVHMVPVSASSAPAPRSKVLDVRSRDQKRP